MEQLLSTFLRNFGQRFGKSRATCAKLPHVKVGDACHFAIKYDNDSGLGVDDETPLFVLAAKVSFRVQYRLGELLKGEQIVIVFFFEIVLRQDDQTVISQFCACVCHSNAPVIVSVHLHSCLQNETFIFEFHQEKMSLRFLLSAGVSQCPFSGYVCF